jgi:signal transduction histidine kinase
MTVRTRTFIACLLAALLPLGLFAFGARRELQSRLADDFDARTAASVAVLRQDLDRHAQRIDERLHAIAGILTADPARRAALLDASRGDRAGLAGGTDLAADLMASAGLDYLLITDSAGTVLSAGHFPADYGRASTIDPATRAPFLVTARRPAGVFVAFARTRGLPTVAGGLGLVGGVAVDSAFVRDLAREPGATTVALDYPGGSILSDPAATDVALAGGLTEQVAMPFVDDVGASAAPDAAAAPGASTAAARWTITHSFAPLRALRAAVDRWFLVAAGAAILVAFVIARILAARLSRPIEELARRATRVDIERTGVGFATRRPDEIGTLSRMLDAMVQRLRAGAARLRDAERRATVGDMARQVNHDIRNGLLPIRNVVRHLSEVAAESPAELAAVYGERERTLAGGIEYLEQLATSYARLSPRGDERVLDVNDVARDAAADLTLPGDVRLHTHLTDGPLARTSSPPGPAAPAWA